MNMGIVYLEVIEKWEQYFHICVNKMIIEVFIKIMNSCLSYISYALTVISKSRSFTVGHVWTLFILF